MTTDREWKNLKDYPFFTVADVAAGRSISLPSAHVLCNRYVEKAYFIRLKKNFYVLARNWERYGGEDFFGSAIFSMSRLIFHASRSFPFTGFPRRSSGQ
ncbi:MAG: hypothetical protein M0P16_06545 [Syntrophales bacterium]|nr:hypothetical protein [Syntrophales bacterium]